MKRHVASTPRGVDHLRVAACSDSIGGLTKLCAVKFVVVQWCVGSETQKQ
jgi:hypothetical protein